MKITLRDYQLEAVEQTSLALSRGYKRPLIVAPTASGKSLIIAEIITRMLRKNPLARALVLCHQKEILEQNEKMVLDLDWKVKTGAYCDGLKRKETNAQVIFASRDSLANNPKVCGEFDVVIVDEAHLIPQDAWTNSEKNFGKIFTALQPPYVVGLTGTPWRNGMGIIYKTSRNDKRENFFDVLSYDIKMQHLMNRGYLSPYIFPSEIVTVIDASNIATDSRSGEFKSKELAKISMPIDVITDCLDIWKEKASDRNVTLFFACSREHGKLIAETLGKFYVGKEDVAYIDGETNAKDRKKMLIDIKEGVYRCVVNISVLSVGYDAPIIDCICWMRATASVSLFVQMGGRGLRLHEDKEDCLMLDMAGNFERFNSLEDPIGDSGDGSEPEKPEPKVCKKNGCEHENPPRLKFCQQCGEDLPCVGGPIKHCEHCSKENPASAAKCVECGVLFITHDNKPHTKKGVYKQSVWAHVVMPNEKTKAGKPCVKIKISAGGPHLHASDTHMMWVMPDNENKWVADKSKKLLNKFRDYDPTEIMIVPKESGYKDIQVIDWKPKEDDGLGCEHEYEVDTSPMGITRTFCALCGDIK